jgi:hypothetical protein
METQQVQTDSTQNVMAVVAEKLEAAKKSKGKKAERLREEADRLLEKIMVPS